MQCREYYFIRGSPANGSFTLPPAVDLIIHPRRVEQNVPRRGRDRLVWQWAYQCDGHALIRRFVVHCNSLPRIGQWTLTRRGRIVLAPMLIQIDDYAIGYPNMSTLNRLSLLILTSYRVGLPLPHTNVPFHGCRG